MITNEHKTSTKVYTLRIDTQLFEQIKKLAVENKRSIAKEIEFMLEQAITNK